MIERISSECLSVLEEFLPQPGELAKVADGGPLFASGSLDSLALVNLVVALENAFSIEIDAENLEDVFATLGTLVTYIGSKISS